MFLSGISPNAFSLISVILFSVGFTTLMLHRNMIKKIIGFNIMDTAVYLFLASKGYIEGRKAPIITNGVHDTAAYINPIPAGLVLTGIVVSVSVTALMLAITIRLYERYHSLDIDEISLRSKKDSPGRSKYSKQFNEPEGEED
ncbi:MAG: cation:proton antiporter subunit C [Lachnospiraceae bacterium]|nr:cation:proton antiporter subunit C [Lachnospiraceae bacterium]